MLDQDSAAQTPAIKAETESSGTPQTGPESSAEEQILSLQESILSDSEFDFGKLEATAAGESDFSQGEPQDTAQSASSPWTAPVVEQSQAVQFSYSAQSNSYNTAPSDTQASDFLPSQAVSTEDTALLGIVSSEPESGYASSQFASVTEDFSTEVSGNIAGAAFVEQTLTAEFGTLTISDSGSWIFVLDNSAPQVQELGAGDTRTEQISLTDTNGNQHLIQVSLHGNNDRPILSGDKFAQIKAPADGGDHVLVAGKLNIADADAGESRFRFDNDIQTNLGNAKIDALGNWHYTLNPDLDAVKALAEGVNVTDVFAVETMDGSRLFIRVEIEGTNDSATITSVESDFATELGENVFAMNLATDSTASGTLGVHDPDFGESVFQANADLHGFFGTGTIDAEGHWTYTPNPDHPSLIKLEDGQSLNDVISVITADGTRFDIIVQVQSSSSEAVVSSQSTPLLDPSADTLLLSQDDPDASLEIDAGSDNQLFVWKPDTDSTTETIAQFRVGSDGDTLQIADILDTTDSSMDLSEYLHFRSEGDNTILEIHSQQPGTEAIHSLTLAQVDLAALGQSDQEIIQTMLTQGNLEIV